MKWYQELMLHSEAVNAAQSLLLRLPGELRNEVYHYALSANPIKWPCKPNSIATTLPQVRGQTHREVASLIFTTCTFRIGYSALSRFLENLGASRSHLIKNLTLDRYPRSRISDRILCNDICYAYNDGRSEHFAGLLKLQSSANGLENIIWIVHVWVAAGILVGSVANACVALSKSGAAGSTTTVKGRHKSSSKPTLLGIVTDMQKDRVQHAHCELP